MATATQGSVSVFERMEQLRQEAEGHQNAYRQTMQQIADLVQDEIGGGVVRETPAEFELTPRRGRRAHAEGNGSNGNGGGTATAERTGKRRGRRPGSGKKPGPKGGAKGNTTRNYGQEMTLKEAAWDVLSRPKDWHKILPDLPEGVKGLKITEIKKIIEKEENWKSSSSNIAPQLQQHLTALRENDKVERDEESKRYNIKHGAKLE